MKMNYNDYIIRKALNESIDNFLIEEGFWDKLKTIPSKLWNGVKWYMDKSTNGQWNQKYNQYVNGNGRGTLLFYLDKWFKFHAKNIQNLISRNLNPSNLYDEEEIEYDTNNRKTGKIKKYNYDTPEQYISGVCTQYNFSDYVSKFTNTAFEDNPYAYQMFMCMKYYINIYVNRNLNNPTAALKNMNVSSFMKEFGRLQQHFMMQQQNAQQAQQQNAQQAQQQPVTHVVKRNGRLVKPQN